MRTGGLRRAVWLFLALVLCLEALSVSMLPTAAQASANGMVRVKLTRLGSPTDISMIANCDYVVYGEQALAIPAGSDIGVRLDGGNLTLSINGVAFSAGSTLILRRCQGGSCGLRFIAPSLANVFSGDLRLSASGGAIVCVLNIYIEDYLCGVVGYEMSDSYPLEALKAQAVSARNYALKKKASRASLSYDVTDNANDQVFKGYNAAYSRVLQAVSETRGQVLYAGGTLANCYYGDSNGGQTESTKNVWGSSLSYSVVKDDPYDLGNASSSKRTAVISKNAQGLKDELTAALKSGMAATLKAQNLRTDAASIEILSIEDIQPLNPKYASPSRLYQTLAFTLNVRGISAAGAQKTLRLTTEVPTYGAIESWYALSINSSSNETVEVSAGSDAFTITFRRWGHGVGMSQRGAQAMARDYGKSTADILNFYYPGTSLSTLSLSEDGTAAVGNEPEGIATAKIAETASLYAAANADGAGFAQLDAGLIVRVLAVTGAWVEVATAGLQGYVRVAALENFVLTKDPLVPVSALEFVCLGAEAPLLQLPVAGAAQKLVLPVGSLLTVLARSESFAYVCSQDGEEGYISTADLISEEVSPSPSVTMEASPSATIEASPSATIEASPSATVEVSPSATIEVSPSATIEASPSATVEASPSATVEASPSATIEASPTATIEASPSATIEASPTATVGVSPTPTVTPSTSESYVAVVRVSADSRLYLRKRADSTSAVLARMKNGTILTVLGENGIWAFVRLASGQEGYAALRYLNRTGSVENTATPLPTQPIVPEGTSTPTPSVSPTPTIKPSVTPTIDPGEMIVVSGEKYVYVNAHDVYLYDGAAADAAELANLDYGTRVRVYAYNNTWVYVSVDGEKGYIRKEVLTVERPAAKRVDTGVTFCKLTGKTEVCANLYSTNSKSAKVLMQIDKNRLVSILAYKGDWAYVVFGGKRGYMEKAVLTIVF